MIQQVSMFRSVYRIYGCISLKYIQTFVYSTGRLRFRLWESCSEMKYEGTECVCVNMCVYMGKCREEGEHSPLHHFMMYKFPPSFRHALVATAMTSGFLLVFWRVVGCDSHMGRCQHASHFSSSYRHPLTPQLSQMLSVPTSSKDQLLTYCPFLPVLLLTSHNTTSLTMNNISSSPISLIWPV